METREDILKELNGLAPTLAKMEKKNFYSVPENYFLNFKSGVLEHVKVSEVNQELKSIAPELLKVEKKSSVEIPTGYFNLFANDLVRKIRANEVANELQEIAPAISGIEKANRLEVPANYFNAFPAQVMKQIALQQKVEATTGPKWVEVLNNVLENITAVVFKPKYSFAFAGMASILIVAGMMILKVEQECSDIDCKMAAISNEELNAYLDNGNDMAAEEIFEADFTNQGNSEQAVKNVLNEVSDEELSNALLD